MPDPYLIIFLQNVIGLQDGMPGVVLSLYTFGDYPEKFHRNDSQEKPEDHVEIIDVSEYKPRRIPSKQWRDCIKKIYETDPLCCPTCGGEMKIISFITDHEVIRQILKHLGLWMPTPSRNPHNTNFSHKNHEPVYDGAFPIFCNPSF